jgi:hypothetical protein
MGDPETGAQQAPDEEPTETTGQPDPSEPTPADPDTGDSSGNGDGDDGAIFPG